MAAAIHEVKAAGVPDGQLDALHSFASALAPSGLRDALLEMSKGAWTGMNVAVFDDTATCTPADAAERLGMSRTHLYKLLDKGALPFHHVGRDRRLYVKDVMTFAAERDRDRRELAERFARTESDRDAAITELMDEL
ncbi:helix-turn-helix domain-containing protein [Nocardia asteroides]|uniref:helix-turn-helix domain-containing protein n=1 Tax=Nocardia asteroides TaxID=1824 RepID=UPI001E4C6F21|nr:helix-turn-helix domain-containing protein [Nocardia asteroides]UGT64099.1 helix-turn-helix domain-containing protein [Nocardia asteroides]